MRETTQCGDASARTPASMPAAKRTADGLVFRDEVRMLNGRGPLNAPMRTLYVDGSDESLKAFDICEQANIDFSVQAIAPGEPVVLHDRLLHIDFTGVNEVRQGVELVAGLYQTVRSSIEGAITPSMRTHAASRKDVVEAAIEAEAEERHKVMQHAIAAFRS